jgi:simple sugar transport system permease protein
VLALCVGAVFLLANGFDPVVIYREMIHASFATRYGIEDSLVSATPIIFTGLAAAVTFKFKLYNIGAEGQLVVGGICAAAAALFLGDAFSGWIAATIVLVAGMAGGAAWMLVPALARVRLGTSEIITTLLLNYVAILFARFLIFGSSGPLRDPASTNFPQGTRIPAGSMLMEFGNTRVHAGFLLGCLVAVLVFAFMRWTRTGFHARVVGNSPGAARYAGISVAATTLVLLLISGALAGLAGASEVAGRAHRLDPTGLAVGFGYTGIIVAALALYNPLAVIPVAVLLGGLANAGATLQSLPGLAVPSSIAVVLQGAILIFLLAGEIFLLYRVRVATPVPRKDQQAQI